MRETLVLLLFEATLLCVGAAGTMVDQGSGTLAGAADREVSIRLKRPPPLPLEPPPPPVELGSERREAAADRCCVGEGQKYR